MDNIKKTSDANTTEDNSSIKDTGTPPKGGSSSMLTQDAIAELLASLNVQEAVDDVPDEVTEEVTNTIVKVADKTPAPASEPNRMMTPEDIAQLLAAQNVQEAVVETPELESEVEVEPEAEPETINEDPADTIVEVADKTPAPASEPNRMMTPEDIAQLLAAQNVQEAVVETPEPELETEPEIEPGIESETISEEVADTVVEVADETPAPEPNRMMTPEDIAQLLAAQNAQETVVETPEPESEVEPEPEPETINEEVADTVVEEAYETPAPEPNRMMTPEDIAQLLAAQNAQGLVVEVPEPELETEPEIEPEIESETISEEVADTIVEVADETPAPEPNRMMTPEDIEQLLAAQNAQETAVETPEPEIESEIEPGIEPGIEPATINEEVADTVVEVADETPAPEPNRMMTPEDIAQLLAAQNAQETVVETPEPELETEPEPEIEPETINEEVFDTVVEEAYETPAPEPNRMMTPEDIAQLLAAQNIQEPEVEAETINEEVTDTIVKEADETPAPEPNRMMMSEDIEQLLAAQNAQETVVETPEPEPEVEPETEPEPETINEEVADAIVEVADETPAPEPNRMMTPEDIAQLLAAQNAQETVVETPEPELEIEPAIEPETINEEVADTIVEVADKTPVSEPNRMMTPEDIAQLLAAQNAQETVVETPEPEPEVEPETEPEPETINEEVADAIVEVADETPAPEPNRMMTPEDIAQLLAAQNAQEPVVETTEPELEVEPEIEPEPEPETINEEVADAIVEVADETPAPEPNRMMTPEDIEKLLASQNVQEQAVETPEPEPNRMMSPEDIAQLLAAQNIEETVVETSEPEIDEAPTPVPEESHMASPEEIAKFLAAQNVQDTEVEPEIAEIPVPEAKEILAPEPEPASIASPEEIAQSLAAQYNLNPQNEIPEPEIQEIPELEIQEDPVPEIQEDLVPETDEALSPPTEQSKQINFIQKILLTIKSLLTKKSKPVVEPSSEEGESDISIAPSDESDETAKTNKKAGILSRIFSKGKKAPKKPKKSKEPAAEENDSSNVEPTPDSSEPETNIKPAKKSALKTVLVVLVVLLLMGASFAGGFFTHNLIASVNSDPAKAQEEKKAADLTKIDPKEYTSSMYLDSLIIKGRAEKMTSIKLQKIDNIDKLVEFKNLRRIKIKDLTGDEDLSVIQKLTGVEEITIENSVIKNQFKNGTFPTVTYMDLYDSTVENTSQFANFKGLTELEAYTCKFPSSTGNMELTSYLPAIESLTLSNCGNYGELVGAKNLIKLKSLNLIEGTLIENLSYTENPQIETANLDISFAKNVDQLRALGNLKNLDTLTLEVKEGLLSSSQWEELDNWLNMALPRTTVKISFY